MPASEADAPGDPSTPVQDVSTPVQAAVQRRSPITRSKIETVASRSVAIFGLLFGAQALPVVLSQTSQMHDVWLYTIDIAFFAGLLVAVVASILKRFVRTVNAYVAAVYLVSILCWPLAVADPFLVAADRPWLWFMCTVATAAAAIALNTWAATAYLFAAPIAYGVIRVTPSGGGADWGLAALDTAYAIILGGAVLIIITLLRSAAAAVDSAQATALTRYSHAVRQHAIEVERVQVDAIVHDSVLTTLLSAARAFDARSMTLAASMAQRAIGHLKDAASTSPDDESWVPLGQLADRIIGMAKTLSAPFELRIQPPSDDAIPVQAAEAVYSAAVQAMVNSLQHAGSDDSILRWLAIRGTGFGGIRVQIGDTGAGFLLGDVPVERLGLRVSILERVASAGGRAEIDTDPGEGTVIDIEFPAAVSQPAIADGSGTAAAGSGSHPVRASSTGSAVSS